MLVTSYHLLNEVLNSVELLNPLNLLANLDRKTIDGWN